MGRLLLRAIMVLVGLAVLAVYTAGAFAGYLVLRWLFADPPSFGVVLAAFVAIVLVGGYAGYRLGTIRLLASLDAVELPRGRTPEVYRRLERLCVDTDVTQPPLLVAKLGAPNALSIGGPRRGAIVLDPQLFRLLTIDELEGVLAHELAHMEAYDTFINTTVLTAVRSVVGIVFVLLFPVVLLLVGLDRASAWFAGRPRRGGVGLAGLFQLGVGVLLGIVLSVVTLAFLAHSRNQEYAADRRAAELTGKPVALARALSKIHRAMSPPRGLLSLFYIHGDEREDELRRWLSTHPPIERRVERLLAMAGRPAGHHHVGRIRP